MAASSELGDQSPVLWIKHTHKKSGFPQACALYWIHSNGRKILFSQNYNKISPTLKSHQDGGTFVSPAFLWKSYFPREKILMQMVKHTQKKQKGRWGLTSPYYLMPSPQWGSYQNDTQIIKSQVAQSLIPSSCYMPLEGWRELSTKWSWRN